MPLTQGDKIKLARHIKELTIAFGQVPTQLKKWQVLLPSQYERQAELASKRPVLLRQAEKQRVLN